MDDIRLKWSSLEGGREGGREEEGEGGREGRGRERGRGEWLLSLSFECQKTDPANSLMNQSYLLFSCISRLHKHKKS